MHLLVCTLCASKRLLCYDASMQIASKQRAVISAIRRCHQWTSILTAPVDHVELEQIRLAKERKRVFASNPRLARQTNINKRLRYEALNTLTHTGWELVKEMWGPACAYCGTTTEVLTQDHITPLSQGGDHAIENVVPACFKCNVRKHANSLLYFLVHHRPMAQERANGSG